MISIRSSDNYNLLLHEGEQKELKEAFEVYDKDGNGQITALELKQVTFPDKDPATLLRLFKFLISQNSFFK